MTDDKSQSTNRNVGLLPTLGLFSTIMLVVGGVIGSGIFRKSGVMAAQLGSPELLMLVWILAGVITLFGALTNAEIASLIPETGGQYVYFERMYGPFFAFLYGWAIFAIIQCGSIAAVAYVFAEYATQFVRLPEFSPELAGWHFHLWGIGDVSPLAEIGTKGLAAALIVALTAVNYLGVRFGGIVQNIFTIAKVAAMLLLMAGAFLLPTAGGAANFTTPSATVHLSGLALFAGIAAALQGAFWAYDGWNKLTYIAGEVKEPQRNIPLGLLWGMLAVTAIYVLMNVAYLWVLPVDAMAKSKLVAATVAGKIFRGGSLWVAALVMISTLGAANAIILTTARAYYAMARDGAAPRFLARVHPRFHTPGASLAVQGVWSVALLFSGTFDTLTDTLIFVTWIFYAAGAYGVFVMRKKIPLNSKVVAADVSPLHEPLEDIRADSRRLLRSERSYVVPGYPVVPWVFILFALTFLGFTVYNDVVTYRAAMAAGKPALINSVFGVALVLVGTPIYFFYRKRVNA
ncbi:MAG: amino acid permease [Verrucomicrobia bacterium]|nr:MAG: amino acid permease [Verrucomicrobiota bacterium]